MRRRFLLFLTLLLAITLVPVRASAAVDSIKFKGASVFASFSSVDPSDPCVTLFATVSASEGRVKQTGSKSELVSEALVGIARVNNCTGEFLDAFGFTTIPADALQINKLDSATLNTTVDVCDFVTGSCFPVSVNLTWAGEGEIGKDKSKFSSTFGKCTFHSDFKGNFRNAVATGSVIAQGIDFAPVSSEFAQLADVQQGQAEINCD